MKDENRVNLSFRHYITRTAFGQGAGWLAGTGVDKDEAMGAAWFEVAPERGLELLAELRNRLPGYAVPVYVREVAGKTCKEVIVGCARANGR